MEGSDVGTLMARVCKFCASVSVSADSSCEDLVLPHRTYQTVTVRIGKNGNSMKQGGGNDRVLLVDLMQHTLLVVLAQ